MKKIAVILILLTSLHCRKEPFSEAQNQIVGTWELRKLDGGIGGTIEYPAGNGTKIAFHGDSYIKSNTAGVYETGTYSLAKSTTKGEWLLLLKSSPNSVSSSIPITLTSSTLVLLATETCCDVPNLTYEKL